MDMKVSDLNEPKAIQTTIVITHPSDPKNIIYYVSKSHKGTREKKEDGTWPDAITSENKEITDKQQLKSGVNISKYSLKEGNYTVDEVLEQPKHRAFTKDMDPHYTEETATVEKMENVSTFMYWDAFQKKFGDYEIISHDKNINFDHV